MKTKFLSIIMATMMFAGGAVCFLEAKDSCPLAGTPECPLVKEYPMAGTSDCHMVKGERDCCKVK
jgi:hypothetical protein